MKKSKIIAAVVCALALCVALVGCSSGNSGDGGNDAAANFQGDWILSGGVSDGEELDAEAIDAMQQMGLYVYLQLKEDGSAVMSLFGTDMDGSWEVKDAATVALSLEGDTADATLQDDELVLTVQGDSLKFKKGAIPVEAQAEQTDSQDAAADAADSGE